MKIPRQSVHGHKSPHEGFVKNPRQSVHGHKSPTKDPRKSPVRQDNKKPHPNIT
ncbi:MAG: hypothetical protein IJ334_02095 [Clostridia bacterium]|nr:hypothetical protein [Clostridia bacterium]